MGPKTGDSYREADDSYQHLKLEILARFSESSKPEIGKFVLAGQELPKPEACVLWMYALAERAAASSIDERVGSGVYGFLSNMTHPTLYPARQLREWTNDAATGHRVAYLRLDTDFLERQASAAVIAFYNALTYMTSYFGWDTAVCDDLTNRIDVVLPKIFA